MGEESNKYKFNNLQPIAFLRKFNKMADEDQKYPLKMYKKQLRVFPLTKYPLPQFYQKMQGIFETGTKKKDIMNLNTKSKDDVLDEEFLVRHRHFMTKAIEKIIKDNEDQQVSLENYKAQYNTEHRPSRPRKAQSESKLISVKKMRSSQGIQDNKNQLQAQKMQALAKQEVPEKQNEKEKTYLQKVQLERVSSLRNIKKQKIRIRNNSKLQEFLEEQKEFIGKRKTHGEISHLTTGRTAEYIDMEMDDMKKQLILKVLALQQQQTEYQKKYSDNVQSEIQRFNEKVKKSIEKTNKQKFW